MLQYPKNEHITLGSVENWGSNTNILKDPPKSIFTRRIDKVGQNTDITELIDDSADRVNEGIQVYSRGVNPMVSVSYNNQSNNAGISGNPTATSGRTQAFLPYTIMEGGAFRPPVRNPRDLLPLSRLPRVAFSRDAPISAPDYSKTKQQPNDFRAVRDNEDVLRSYDIRPNQSANINVKNIEHFVSDPRAAINEKHINVEGNSGMRSRDITSFTRDNVDRSKGALIEKLITAFAQSNRTQDRSMDLSNLTINEKRYIQNYLAHEGHTNKSMGTAQGLDNMSIDQKRYIQDALAYEALTNKSMGTAQGLDNLSIDQKRYIQAALAYEALSNKSMGTAQGLDKMSIDEHRYIQSVLQAPSATNRSADINAKTIDQLNDSGRRDTVKTNMIQYNQDSGIYTYTKNGDIAQPVLDHLNLPQHQRVTQLSDARVHHRVAHDKDLEFQRNRPNTSVTANVTKIEDLNSMSLSSREARLDPLLKKGGFQNVGYKPNTERADLIAPHRETDKDRLRQSVNQQFTRFNY
jgi:hypothetical protein